MVQFGSRLNTWSKVNQIHCQCLNVDEKDNFRLNENAICRLIFDAVEYVSVYLYECKPFSMNSHEYPRRSMQIKTKE